MQRCSRIKSSFIEIRWINIRFRLVLFLLCSFVETKCSLKRFLFLNIADTLSLFTKGGKYINDSYGSTTDGAELQNFGQLYQFVH